MLFFDAQRGPSVASNRLTLSLRADKHLNYFNTDRSSRGHREPRRDEPLN